MKRNKDLTVGSPFKTLLLFSLPMLLSVTLQQFYNICDSLISGNMIKDSAATLAAINSTYPITMIFLAIATGFGVGINIVLARFIGMKDYKSSKEIIYTSIISAVALGIILTLLMFFLVDPILRVINVSNSYFNKAGIYLKWYILGLAFLILYNAITNIFQAMGKSSIPLLLLFFSTVINIILDIIFVINISDIEIKIRGIAVATFIAQALYSVLALIVLLIIINKKYDDKVSKIYNLDMLKKILPLAIPSIIQASIISLGQLLIQTKINQLDILYPGAVAGYGASYKICYAIVNIYTMMSNAISTFTSQNAGAKKYERIRSGYISGLILCGILTVITTTIFLIFPEQLMSIFASDGEKEQYFISTGKKFIYYVSPFFFLMCFKIPCDGVLKGSKDMRNFLISTFSDLFVRVSLTYILEPVMGMDGIFISWPIGWAIGMILSVFFYFKGRWKKLIGYSSDIVQNVE